jgi:hypothetical protein
MVAHRLQKWELREACVSFVALPKLPKGSFEFETQEELKGDSTSVREAA